MSVIYGQPITFGGGNTKAPAIFGDGSDGVAIISADTQWLAETEDTGMIVKNFESLTIPEGVTVSAGNRNCGMIIRVTGDCTIAGSLVNKLSPKTILDSDGVDFSIYPPSMLAGTAGDGGDGGNGQATYGASPSVGGVGMVGRFYGGGWSGGGAGGGIANYEYCNGGAGGSVADITTATTTALFVGGAATYGSVTSGGYAKSGSNGGGGATFGSNNYGGAGGSGPGGNGVNAINLDGYGGGGAGNYGGGVIILLVGGKLTITGAIDCSGSKGGDAGIFETTMPWGAANYAGSGGGGGGGRIFICHKGDISNAGTLNVNGGAAGAIAANGTGTVGEAGSIGTTAVKTYKQYMEEDAA